MGLRDKCRDRWRGCVSIKRWNYEGRGIGEWRIEE
jgi:hypothetical protein